MKYLLGLLIITNLIGCAKPSNSPAKRELNAEWTETLRTCLFGVDAFSVQTSSDLNVCLNIEDARSLNTSAELEAYVTSCVNPQPLTFQFNTNNEVVISYDNGANFCENTYTR